MNLLRTVIRAGAIPGGERVPGDPEGIGIPEKRGETIKRCGRELLKGQKMITKLTIYENYKFPEDRERDLKINEIIEQLNQSGETKEFQKSLLFRAGALQRTYRIIVRMRKLCKDQCPSLYKQKLSRQFCEITDILEYVLKDMGESYRLREYDKDGNSRFDVLKINE